MSKSYYDVKAVSNSSLKWFDVSPLYFISKYNSELDEGTKPWLELGKAVHAAILEPKEYEALYRHFEYDVPKSEQQRGFCAEYTKQLKATKSHKISLSKAFTKNYNIKGKSGDKILTEGEKLYEKLSSYIEYLESKERKDKMILSDKQKNVVDKALAAVKKHSLANKLLFDDENNLFNNVDTHNELEVYFQYPMLFHDHKIDCKAMLDRIIIDHDKKIITLVDLKTASDITKIKDAIKDFKYHRQLAFYSIAATQFFTKNYPDKNIAEYNLNAYIVFAQTTELYECRVIKVDANLIFDMLPEISAYIDSIAWHFANNQWDYPRDYYSNEDYLIFNKYDT